MNKLRVFLLASCLFLMAARCSTVQPDKGMSAALGGDYTVMIQGCGAQPIVGYAYCRKTEGASTESETLSLFGPPAECKGSGPCVSFKIFYPDGSPTLGKEIPRGQTKVSLKWFDLTKKKSFDHDDVGFWGVVRQTKWLDPDGNEQMTQDLGEIRLRVMATQYIPLHEVSEDPNFVWQWVDDTYIFKMTTAGRSYIGKATP